MPRSSNHDLRIFCFSSIIGALFLSLQFYINSEIENIICTTFSFFGWFVMTIFVLQAKMIRQFPLSALSIMGFGTSTLCFPLVFMTLDGRELSFNLVSPIDTFGWCLGAFVVLILSHFCYRKFTPITKIRRLVASGFLVPLRILQPPRTVDVWILGVIGLMAMLSSRLLLKSEGDTGAGLVNKLLDGLVPFVFSPYLLPTAPVYGGKRSSVMWFFLALYTVVVFTAGILLNARGVMVIGLVMVGIVYSLAFICDGMPFHTIHPVSIIVLGVGAVVVFGPLSDLAIAMQIARADRGKVGFAELAKNTFAIFQDKKLLREFEFEAKDSFDAGGYSEYYLQNVFASRFCNMKYPDLAISQAKMLDQESSAILSRFEFEQVLSIAPLPLLRLLGLNIDKAQVQMGSYGDMMFCLANGSFDRYGSKRTGHFLGTELVIWGNILMPIALAIFSIPFFLSVDSLTSRATEEIIGQEGVAEQRHYESKLPFVGLLMAFYIFGFFNAESFGNVPNWVLRTLPQNLVIYAFLLFCVRQSVATLRFT